MAHTGAIEPVRQAAAEESLGDRLRRLRLARGMTQEGLALTAGVSVDVVKRLERGAQAWARLPTIRALADGLDAPLSELTGRRPRVSRPGEHLALGIRDALHAAVLPGLTPEGADAEEPVPVGALRREVDTAWAVYSAGAFERLAARVPALLAESRRPLAGSLAEAAVLQSQVLQLTAQLLVHLGREDLAGTAAERAVRVAVDGADPLQWATAGGTVAWVHHAGFARPASAVDLALAVADEIEPGDDAPSEAVVVWGTTLVTGLAAAGATGDAAAVDEILPAARRAAQRLGGEQVARHAHYGPSSLGMQVVYSELTLGRPDRALAAAQDVNVDELRPVSHARHLADLAQALTELGRHEDAVYVLARAEAVAPAWFAQQQLVRGLLDEIASRQARLSSALRRLVQSTAPPPREPPAGEGA